MDKLAQDLIATLRESLVVLDHDFKVTIANQSFYRTFEVGPEEVENYTLFQLGNGQWNIPSLHQALLEIAAKGTTLEDFEVEHYFPHIGHKVMHLNARQVVRAPDEKPLILLAIEDVTERHQAEFALQNSLRQLQASNRQLEDFAFIASHDLQEPLRAIQTFSTRLQDKNADDLDERGRDYLMRIQRAASRMRLLISDLLSYSRITTQAKPFEPIQLTTIAHECVNDLTKRLEETGGTIEFGELPTLDADPVQMRQLLQNLLDNGLKFHQADLPPLVTLTALSSPPADFEAEGFVSQGKAQFCYLSIQDNGIGFEERHKERIFLPFERLHTQARYSGSGIGLAICHRIVERHNGRLTATSVPGQGTTFFIALPLHQPTDTFHPGIIE